MRHPGLKPLAVLLLILGCHRAGVAGTSAALVSNDAFAATDETVELPAPRHAAIYREVLRFYRPSGNQMRLLNPALLPSHSGEESGGMIDPAVAAEIMANLGDGFCLRGNPPVCHGRSSGGELRISPVYRQPDRRVRVVTRYISMDQYAPEQSSTQVFLLEQSKGRWVIRARR